MTTSGSAPALRDLSPDDYDALVVCGGHGPMFQFRDHEDLKRTIGAFYEAEKPTAALCHGTCALLDVKLSDGAYRIEDEAKHRGANFIQGGLFRAFAIRDRQLITGQQRYSGAKVAEIVIDSLGI
jgi:putative intracellular protease/amidase